MALTVNEQSIAELSPNEKAMLDARALVRSGALRDLAKNDDATLVFGLCQGSGSTPYSVSMDLASGTDKPTLRCSCPSRQRPCKHALGLMLAFVQKGATFPVAAPPQDLLEKRAKQAEKAEPKARAAADAPRNVNKSALAKKAKEQIDTLETLGNFLVDLVGAGVGGITPKIIEEIEQQSKRMADANITAAAGILRRLAASVAESADDDDDEDTKKAARGFSADKEARVAWMLTQLHAIVRRGTKLLDGRLESEGVSVAERDATYEAILGRRWQLPDLKQAGYWVTNRRLLELSHERVDDDVTEFATATGFLLDLEDGTIVREWTALPYNTLKFQKLRVSRRGTLVISEAALYPGELVNRRIRWDEKTPGIIEERSREPADYEKLHGHAKSIDAAIKALRNQMKNPVYPLDAVVLIAAARFGTIGSELVVQDAAGDQIVMRDAPDARLPATIALRQAAAAYGPGSLATRLYFDLPSRSIYGEPLALVVGDEHLRLRA